MLKYCTVSFLLIAAIFGLSKCTQCDSLSLVGKIGHVKTSPKIIAHGVLRRSEFILQSTVDETDPSLPANELLNSYQNNTSVLIYDSKDKSVNAVAARDPSEEDCSTASMLKDIYSVAIPALAACIVEPALSLVDTYYVGKAAATATVGLAGMSINGALFNIIAAATAPLGTGTTAVISRVRGLQEQKANGLNVKKPMSRDMNMNKNINQNENEKKEFSVGEIFLSGIFLAAAGGTVLSSICHLFGEGFVAQVFQIKGSLLDATAEYLKIRSLSLPSVLLNYIVFGFSIAMQDSIAPVLSIVTAFIFNVLGDYVLVGRMGYSLTGAAIATALSSYLGSFVALRHIFKTYKIRLPRTAKTEEGNKDDKIDALSSSNKRWGRRRGGGGIMWRRIFNKQGMEMFFTASGPLLAGAMVNTMTYSAGARIASFTQDPMLSTVQVAAHQIVMQSWWFLSYFSSPFSLVAQAVIPKDLIKGNTKRVKRMAALLLKLTAAAGVIVTAINVLLILQFPGTFTKNLDIQSIARNVLLPSSVSLFIICMSTVSDGIFIGCNAVQDYLAASVLSTTAAWLYYAFSINNKLGLTGAWNGLLIFSVVRMGYYCTKYGKLWASVDKYNNSSSNTNSNSNSSKQ